MQELPEGFWQLRDWYPLELQSLQAEHWYVQLVIGAEAVVAVVVALLVPEVVAVGE